ncbi:MAG: ACT domain-containing protein [Candidatus Caldatribacterium sp.]|uniref:ACT domain-containing protein n=1 Tax=Candidatus Caldatribacterium sp. TaxID=2282143 RepID=UPI0029980020|nr:ACT domain-containing protein [Candidatus Caldatribacterium sp.]MCX7730233.1 ACT domain-containing protein [Candidatus Caldatribacterium sp.]MDW8081031.1 ACT domain-containing protein [Candidatus Calescibacterium sp.]
MVDPLVFEEEPSTEHKVVITVVGKDRIGIIAAITSCLAEHQVNIEDITQKILGEYFTMILVGDTSRCPVSLSELRRNLVKRGKEVGVRVYVQHASIFRAMHRV